MSEAQVTVGYLVRRASTSGGHWDTGGGDGEPGGGVGKTKHEMPYNQWKYYDEKENPSQEWVAKLLLAKNYERMNFFQILIVCVQNSRKE